MWIGVHYEYPFGGMTKDRPEWKPKGAEDWRRDLAAIKDTGFDHIRIRVGLDTDIDDIETLLTICQRLDLKVVFGSAMFYVPDAFVRKYPDSATVTAEGDRVPRNDKDYSWPRACVHHPVFRARRDEYWEACAKRFANHPAIIAWDVHNEPSLTGCYCKNTLAVYRKAVEKEFGGVNGYNKTFGTSFKTLATLDPPRERKTNIPAFRHWRMFMIGELSRFLNEARDIVRKYVPDLPITYNPQQNLYDPMHSGSDWWNLRQYEFMSQSLYWGSGERTQMEAVTLQLLKALGPGKPLWISEFQGGPFFNPTLLTGKHMVMELNAAFAHGIQGLIYYRWDPLLCGAEPWINGLVEVDTDDTERRLTLKEGIKELRRHESLIGRSRSQKPSVGLLMTREQVLHSSEYRYGLSSAVPGYYSMLSAAGYEMGIVPDSFDPATCEYEAMVFPYLFLDDGLIQKIKEYAKSGRLAIVELPRQDIARAKMVGAAFGLTVTECDQPNYWLTGWDLRGTGAKPGAAAGKYIGFAAGDRLLFNSGKARVLATYGLDHKPALVLPDGFDGNILVSGFPLGQTHGEMLHEGIRNFVGGFLQRKVKPDICVKGAHDAYRALIDARVLETDKEGLLFVINRSLYDYDLEIAVKGYAPVKVKSGANSVAKKRLKHQDAGEQRR
jgi:hypothetical protein